MLSFSMSSLQCLQRALPEGSNSAYGGCRRVSRRSLAFSACRLNSSRLGIFSGGVSSMDDLIALRAGTVIPVARAETARQSLDRMVHSQDWARLIVDYLHRKAAAKSAA